MLQYQVQQSCDHSSLSIKMFSHLGIVATKIIYSDFGPVCCLGLPYSTRMARIIVRAFVALGRYCQRRVWFYLAI